MLVVCVFQPSSAHQQGCQKTEFTFTLVVILCELDALLEVTSLLDVEVGCDAWV